MDEPLRLWLEFLDEVRHEMPFFKAPADQVRFIDQLLKECSAAHAINQDYEELAGDAFGIVYLCVTKCADMASRRENISETMKKDIVDLGSDLEGVASFLRQMARTRRLNVDTAAEGDLEATVEYRSRLNVWLDKFDFPGFSIDDAYQRAISEKESEAKRNDTMAKKPRRNTDYNITNQGGSKDYVDHTKGTRRRRAKLAEKSKSMPQGLENEKCYSKLSGSNPPLWGAPRDQVIVISDSEDDETLPAAKKRFQDDDATLVDGSSNEEEAQIGGEGDECGEGDEDEESRKREAARKCVLHYQARSLSKVVGGSKEKAKQSIDSPLKSEKTKRGPDRKAMIMANTVASPTDVEDNWGDPNEYFAQQTSRQEIFKSQTRSSTMPVAFQPPSCMPHTPDSPLSGVFPPPPPYGSQYGSYSYHPALAHFHPLVMPRVDGASSGHTTTTTITDSFNTYGDSRNPTRRSTTRK